MSKRTSLARAQMELGSRLPGLLVMQGKIYRFLVLAVSLTNNMTRPYCRAFSANPQDKSVCTNKNVKGDWKFDVADYAYEWDGTNFKYVGK